MAATTRSSTRSPIRRGEEPLRVSGPHARKAPPNKSAPTRRSLALLVVTAPLLTLVPVPLAPTATSSGPLVLIPLYSTMRTSGYFTVVLKVTVTVLAPAAAAAMLVA